MKTEKRIGTVGTGGYELSVAGEDLKKKIVVREAGWSNSETIPTLTFEFSPKEACTVVVNGLRSTIPAGGEYQPEGTIYTFVTETAGVECYLSMTF